jgi:hypothetical protein
MLSSPSLPGLTRQSMKRSREECGKSIFARQVIMDARIKSGHDDV